MGRVVAHPEYVSNDGRHAAGSPELPTETERFRSPGQQGQEPRVVGGRQARARARGGSTAERLAATLSGAAQPLADRAGADPERRRNRAPGPALQMQLPRLQAPPFAPVVWGS
jgi:hypothetical protein